MDIGYPDQCQNNFTEVKRQRNKNSGVIFPLGAPVIRLQK